MIHEQRAYNRFHTNKITTNFSRSKTQMAMNYCFISKYLRGVNKEIKYIAERIHS